MAERKEEWETAAASSFQGEQDAVGPVSPLEQHLQALLEKPEAVAAAAAVLVVLLMILLIRLFGRSKKGSAVVLVGPCGAGKTTLFYQLKDGSAHLGTVASMQENEGVAQVRNDKDKVVGSVRIVDVPGHAKLRHKLEKHLAEALAVVFVVDATDITPHRVEAAEELFEVLTHPYVARRRISVLIACNKMDLETQAHSVDFVRKTLEKQLDAMRKTRTALQGDAGRITSALGKLDKPFSLASVRSPVSTGGISAEKGDLQDLHAFLIKAMRG